MNDFSNPVAELHSQDSGILVSPEEAKSFNYKQKLYCPDMNCLDPERILFIKKSSQGNLFFSHRPGFGHNINPETILHKEAIKWFGGINTYKIPSSVLNPIDSGEILYIDKEKTRLEFNFNKRIIPDVIITTMRGITFAIEIVVTHDIDEYKKKLIYEFELPTIKVDLSGFYYENYEQCKGDIEFVRSYLPGLMTDVNLLSWVISPLAIVEKKGSSQNTGCLLLLVILILIISYLNF